MAESRGPEAVCFISIHPAEGRLRYFWLSKTVLAFYPFIEGAASFAERKEVAAGQGHVYAVT